MLVELHKYTLEKGWELVHSYGEGKITAQLEEDVNIHSRTDLFGYLLVLTEGQDPFLCVYFHNGNKMVHPSILKGSVLSEPTPAQKFLEGVAPELIDACLKNNTTLVELFREMITEFSQDVAHEKWPNDFFNQIVVEMAGGYAWADQEGVHLDEPDLFGEYDYSEEPEDNSMHFNDGEEWEQD